MINFSFQICYEQEFKEPLPIDDSGVPLEHLITCIPNIEIKSAWPNTNIKIIKFSEAKSNTENEGKIYLYDDTNKRYHYVLSYTGKGNGITVDD